MPYCSLKSLQNCQIENEATRGYRISKRIWEANIAIIKAYNNQGQLTDATQIEFLDSFSTKVFKKSWRRLPWCSFPGGCCPGKPDDGGGDDDVEDDEVYVDVGDYDDVDGCDGEDDGSDNGSDDGLPWGRCQGKPERAGLAIQVVCDANFETWN